MQFILEGSINVHDNFMNIITTFNKHEIYGLIEFYE